MRIGNPELLRRQRGIALITSMLLLLVVTIMAVSMFRSFGMQEKIAGNTREKQRALAAAISAQQYAEWWLSNSTAPVALACTAKVNSINTQVCTNAPVNVSNVPWMLAGAKVGVTYTPFTTNGNTLSGTTGTPTTTSYYDAPVFYITDLGVPAGGSGEVYQIDAVGYGGTANAVAVVESTYMITQGTARSPDK
jgi:type IV pilus assembly protein PilX